MSSVSSPVRWGIIGPGAIAQDFQRGVAGLEERQDRCDRHAEPEERRPRRNVPRRAHPRRLPGAARRRASRGGLYRHAASRPRRVGDQGGRGWQARARRKADGADGVRDRRRAARASEGRHVRRRGVHVSPASADGEAWRAHRLRRHRRDPHDPVELRLPDVPLHPGAPALCQRSCRRRHPRCRRLPGFDGPLRRGRGGRQTVPRSDQGFGHGPLGAGRHRRMVGGRPDFRERHHRSGVLRGLCPARQHAAHPWRHRQHRGAGLSGSPAARGIRASARSISSRARERARRSV